MPPDSPNDAPVHPDRPLSSGSSAPSEPSAPAAGADGEEGPELFAALAELSAVMLATTDLEALLGRLARLAARSLGVDVSCGITISAAGRAYTVASSDDRASRVDEVQYANGDGPCLQTLRTGLVVEVADQTEEGRWGAYPAHALAEGVRSSLSLPMDADRATVGALNLYSGRVGGFDDAARAAGSVLAAGAAGAVGLALRMGHHERLSAQLQEALSSRAVIERAVGIVIRDRRCTPEEAFAYLRTASQHRNVKLRQVATELVTAMAQPAQPVQRERPARPARP